MGKVIVHYVDENGKVLTEKIITEGQVNVDTYLTEKLSFDNYNFVKVEGEETGTYTEEDTIVTYVYSYNDPIPNTGIVDNNIEEIIFVTALLTLVCYVVLKRKVIF